MARKLLFAGGNDPQRAPEDDPELAPRQAVDVGEVEVHDAWAAGVDLVPTGDARQPLRSMTEPAVHQRDTFIVFGANHVDVLLH